MFGAKRSRSLLMLFSVMLAGLALLLLSAVLPAQAANGDYALDFDGQSDWVELDRAINVIGSTWRVTKTVTLWARPMGPAPIVGDPTLGDLLFGDHPRWFGMYWANMDGSDKIWVVNFDGNSPPAMIGFAHDYGSWVHVALVHDDDELAAYKNGRLVGTAVTGPTAQIIEDTNPGQTNGIRLRLGGNSTTSYEVNFLGQLDETAVWSTVRSADEIRANMYRELVGSETGLAGYYQMSNGSGLILTDNSVNSNDGLLRDGWASGPAPPDGDTAEWIASGAFTGPRRSLDFDGTNDYVALGENGNTIFGSSWASTKSIELWLNPTGSTPIVASASLGDWIVGGPSWGISQARVGGQQRLWLWNNDGDEDRIGLRFSAGEWTHVALIHSGGNLSAYQGGEWVGTISSGSSTTDGNVTIGGRSGGQAFAGELDELRLWNDARSRSELLERMAQTADFDSAGLAAYYRFDQDNDASRTDVTDTSGGYDGTMTNMAPASDWMTSTVFNTWIGSENPRWISETNWSRTVSTGNLLGITHYTNSHTATISTTQSLTGAVVMPGATLLATDTVTINGDVANLGTIDAVTLTVAAGAGLELVDSGVLTVSMVLSNNGTLRQAQTVAGSTPVSFFDTGGYGGLTIDPSGQSLGSTAVAIRGNQDCTVVSGETVRRCFEVTPSLMPGSGVTMTFYFADSELSGNTCASTDAYHWNGVDYDILMTDGRDCTGPLNVITVTDVITFSPFILQSSTPTAVRLHAFETAAAPMQWTVTLILVALLALTMLLIFWRRANWLTNRSPSRASW